MTSSLIDKIEEYGRLQFDAGMDGASWDPGRRRDGRRSEEEAQELLTEIRNEIATFNPDWQPIETAPKDGTRVVLRQVFVDNKTGQLKESYVSVFWGEVPGYPDSGEHWMSAVNDGSFYEDREFVHQETIGKDNKLYNYWHGTIHTHWARLWEVKVEMPPLPIIKFTPVKYNL